MRYLWVEDFDGGESGQTEKKSSWETYFELKDKTINDYRILEDVLEFLDDHSNWRKFDAVLIDIRFKVCGKEQDEKNIYDNYFSSFLTEEKFDDYAKKINGDPYAAASGVLLYLALIYRYHFNQERIAFISANINASSGELACFRKMRELIAKARYQDLSPTDKDAFELLNEDAYDLYKKEKNAGDFLIPETEDINWKCLDCLDKLEKKIMDVEKEITERLSNDNHNDGADLKYNSVKEEFEKLGLKLPIAFEKPGDSEREKISWLFKEWQERKLGKDDYYKLRSNLLDICLSIQKLLEKLELESFSIIQKEALTEMELETEELEQVFSDIMLLFPENSWVDENISLYPKVIKTCVAIFDKIKLNGLEEKGDGEKKVLKLTRNWMSHQGIKDITAHNVAFVFHIMINTVIHIERNEDLQNKDKNLVKEFSKGIRERSVEEINDMICKKKEKYRKMHEEGYQEFEKSASQKEIYDANKRGYKIDEEAKFHEILSGIGNERSPKRKQVSMQMLYVLYLSSLDITEDLKEDFFVQSVLNEVCEE